MLSDRARQVLADSGWTVDRAVDPEPAQEALRADGYGRWADVPLALGSLLGLVVEFKRPQDGLVERFALDPADGTSGEDPELVADWSRRAGEPLCPIGQAFRGNMTLVLGDSGVVYAGRDDLLFAVAPTIEGAVEELTTGSLLTDKPDIP
ncbi:MAG: hypothetical protein QOE45_1974 [Frankiaceae bacterium]|jgi:hypothetical protein|nr:hypothetical protein [Frankiaceae bacterium]